MAGSKYVYVLLVVAAIFSAVRPEGWLHCTTLDSSGKYHICWRLHGDNTDTEIEFRVEVETHGYVGFGLSPNGGMTGSDIVTGWIKDGSTYFQDRHAKGNIMPEIDASQDWKLVSGSENDTHTCFEFRRKLDTCDKDDVTIDDSTMRLIYAYSEEDPKSENDIQYHFKRRGTKSALLLLLPKTDGRKTDKSALSRWDVLSLDFEFQSTFTTKYWCKIYKAPQVSEKNHIVLVEPFIQEGHEPYIHHVLLFECMGAQAEEFDPHLDSKGYECRNPNMPDAMRKCQGVVVAWGVGGQDLVFPENVGLPLETGPSKYYMMETHYNNPSKLEGFVDHSGLRLYYTHNLRKYDAGTLMFGSTVTMRMFIPPGQKEYIVAGHSNPACLDPVMPRDGVNFLGAFLHAHILGRRIKARHFRNGMELQPIAEDNNYDFNYQEYRYNQEEVKFLPGDRVTVECVYDSSLRNMTTFGGESVRDEMCMVFLLYYPRVERFGSDSVPKIDTILKAVGKNFTKSLNEVYNGILNLDWDKVNVSEVQELLRYGLHDTHCYVGDGEKKLIKNSISYPENLQPIKKVSSCIRSQSQMHGYNVASKENLSIFFSVLLILVTLNAW